MSLILNSSSVRDRGNEDGWRNTDAGGQVTLRLDSAIPGMLRAICGRVPLVTQRTKRAHRPERGLRVKGTGTFFYMAPARGETGATLERSPGRAADIHHIVSHAKVFFVCAFI